MALASPYSRPEPKIGPSLGHNALKPDGSPNDPDRAEIGPTDLAFAEWAELGITAPNLPRMREFRLKRITDQLSARDLGGVLLFDPLNIRYATDSSNMQLWTAHNPARAAFVGVDGHVVLWDFHGSTHLTTHLPLINEVRGGAGFFYFVAGDAEERKAEKFAAQIAELLQRSGGTGARLAVDKIEPHGLVALQALGIQPASGQAVLEHARSIKSVDDLNAMRCAIATCEISMAAMEEAMEPGMAEVELWAILHAENIKRGGEWIETRILSSGPRTNPWMQEAGPRRMQAGELMAFDTDLIGPYGMCCDISRTWLVGDGQPDGEQKRLYQVAYEHIMTNMALLKPGLGFRELTERAHRLPAEFVAQRYGVLGHGVGLCDEFPSVHYPEDFIEGSFDYEFEPGMCFCVEAYIGAEGGKEGVKLEQQLLITETGYEDLTRYPFDARLLS